METQRPSRVRNALRWVGIVGVDAVACLLALAAWAVLASAAGAETRKDLPFEVAWGEITLVKGEIALVETEQSYRIEGQGRTRGPLNVVSPWSTELSAAGAMTERGRIAEVFQSQSSNRNGERRVAIRYVDGSPASVDIAPPADNEPRTPVEEAEIRDVGDALSFFGGALDAVRASGGA